MNGKPLRDDHVARWLKAVRDTYQAGSMAWFALDNALENYRLHADTGTYLDESPYEDDDDPLDGWYDPFDDPDEWYWGQ